MRIEVRDAAPKVFPRKSHRFVCCFCGQWLVELVPVVRVGMKNHFQKQKFPRVKLKCPNGHERSPRWKPVDPFVKMRS